MTKSNNPTRGEPESNRPGDMSDAHQYTPDDSTAHKHKCCHGPIPVTITPRAPADTEYGELNSLIRYQIQAISFPEYQRFMDNLAEGIPYPKNEAQAVHELGRQSERLQGLGLHKIHGVAAYELLSLATSVWLLTRSGPLCMPVDPDAPFKPLDGSGASEATRWGTDAKAIRQRITDYLTDFFDTAKAATPYLDLIVEQVIPTLKHMPKLDRLYKSRWECPDMIELIWSYWHEEGMQCQTMNAIALRFQNRRSRQGRDPLADLEIDPLRPLSNLVWGWVEASYKRLTVERRAYEYDHHYGITLFGKAVPQLLSADSRSKFLEAFHSLLHIAHLYYQEQADTTRIPDGFPLLNALRHVHLILAEGAHNQYGDLPWTARVEMLIEQWLMARPEMREFLRGRLMVPYQETWMGQVDTMKKLQGWSDVSITHFHELGTCGEAILLSVRHGPWATTNDQNEAKTWADYWRPEIQRYIYAYKAATGVDLTLEPVNSVMPARLLQARLNRQLAATGHAMRP